MFQHAANDPYQLLCFQTLWRVTSIALRGKTNDPEVIFHIDDTAPKRE